MLTAIKGLLVSKKFYLTIIGAAVVAGLNYAGVSSDIVMIIGSLFGLNIAGQGLADLGKNAK